MNEENEGMNQPKEQEVMERRSGKYRRILTMVCVMAMALCPTALAEGESPATGLANVAAQASTATTWIGNVFNLITGNDYLALMMAFGLLAAGMRIFRRAKRTAR